MVSINRSFLYGIGFASVTWIVSLYLYARLTQSADQRSSKEVTGYFRDLGNNGAPGGKFKPKKEQQDTKFNKKYQIGSQNSIELLDKLRPVQKDHSQKTADVFEQELFELGLVQNEEEQATKDEGYKTHAFNVLMSNKLSLHRNIPDTRNSLCKTLTYQPDLPSATIIICFYNEHYKTLLRSVRSILDRTPENLLNEIILVNDFSDHKGLHEDLEDYVKNLNKVKLLRTDRREGLIRARIFGARQAKGQVLVFLDSHIEVNRGWIEPLLDRIKSNRTNVVMPVIDIINPDTFGYSSSPLVRGGFNWGLHFKWDNLPKGTLVNPGDFVKPIKSPTMAGGLFAIDRKYFIDMGEYDAGMNIWGGENLEISFRIWMCGGSLDLIPCSRIGHIFRHRRPYSSPDGQDTMLYNSLRVAHVWLDDYKDFYLSQNKQHKQVDFGDVSSRVRLRHELKCRDFDWYLKHVYPELALPSDSGTKLKQKWSALERDEYRPWHSRKRNYIDRFYIRLANSSLCVQSSKDTKTKGGSLVLRPCGGKPKNQVWYQTDKNELVLNRLLCLQASKPHPILYKCHELGADQEWKHKSGTNTPIYNLGAGTCLAVPNKTVNATLQLKLCTDPHLSTWDIVDERSI